MREFLQTVIPVVLTALIAGQVAITRTGRLRKDIRETIDLLGKLPAGHPSRGDAGGQHRGAGRHASPAPAATV
jgi:hypothetical protein